MSWLIGSGRIDFSFIKKLILSYPFFFLAALILFLAIPLLGALRWLIILKQDRDFSLSFRDCLKMNWIGLFFNSFLPGAVSGDFIKLFYVKTYSPQTTKTYLLGSIALDRVLGLMALLFLMGLFALLAPQSSLEAEEMNLFWMINALFFGAGLVGISFIFLSDESKDKIRNYLPKKITNFLDKIWAFGSQKKGILKAFGLGIVIQVFSLFSFWLLASPFIGDSIHLFHFLSLVPIGLITIALPLSPAGLGVGHVAFEFLFSRHGIPDGASLFNLFYLVQIMINSLGVIPYLMMKKEVPVEQSL